MKHLSPLVLAAFALGACGNYSNEDLDFQLALPQEGELEAKLPQALTLDTSPEYYKLTRKVVTTFNGCAAALTGLVDHVRAYPPTSRNGAKRVWGPFADDKHPGWQILVTMVRSADPSVPAPAFRISYSVQLRDTTQSGSTFFDLMTGTYNSSSSAGRGDGDMVLDLIAARTALYPVDDFGELEHLSLVYNTADYPSTVNMVIQNVPGAKTSGADYTYTENADGSGILVFYWMVDAVLAVPGTTNVKFISRWLGSGAGRADAYVPDLAGNTPVATDCWDPNTAADYVMRWNGQGDLGSVDQCVF